VDGVKLSIIEVKSGRYYKEHISLDRAKKDDQAELYRRIVLSKNNLETGADGVIYYPLYMAMFV
jgi:hypothetical protein